MEVKTYKEGFPDNRNSMGRWIEVRRYWVSTGNLNRLILF